MEAQQIKLYPFYSVYGEGRKAGGLACQPTVSHFPHSGCQYSPKISCPVPGVDRRAQMGSVLLNPEWPSESPSDIWENTDSWAPLRFAETESLRVGMRNDYCYCLIWYTARFRNHWKAKTQFSFSRKRDFTSFLLTIWWLWGPLYRPVLIWGTQRSYSSSPKPHFIITTTVPTSYKCWELNEWIHVKCLAHHRYSVIVNHHHDPCCNSSGSYGLRNLGV